MDNKLPGLLSFVILMSLVQGTRERRNWNSFEDTGKKRFIYIKGKGKYEGFLGPSNN